MVNYIDVYKTTSIMTLADDLLEIPTKFMGGHLT